jgi:hypothetical protein
MRPERIEALTEILFDNGITATGEQIKRIAEDFSLNIEMEHEMESYQHIGHKEECSECKRLKAQISDLEDTINIHENSVKRRRNADTVWVDKHDRSVKYE